MQHQQQRESAFHNVQAQGRTGRILKSDRHAFEKQRLASRKEGFQRHDPETNPLKMKENALGYLKESDRFHTDVAGEEKARRDYHLQRKQHIIEQKRQAVIAREHDRFEKFEKFNQKDETMLERKRNNLDLTKKNNSSVQYDVISLESKNERDRAIDQFQREKSYYCGATRSAKLFQKDSSVSYNVLTGEARVAPSIPKRPSPPRF